MGSNILIRKGYVTRGVLLDIAGYRGVDRLPIPESGDLEDPGIITISDIEGTIKKQKIAPLGQGDVGIFHTGHGKYWGRDWDSLNDEQKAENKRIFNSGDLVLGLLLAVTFLSRKSLW